MLNQVEITILAENRVNSMDLIAETGLSFHIASSEGNFLFDTGSKNAFLQNARSLGIDLGQVDAIIFSHGHYDHTGGLYHYLKAFGKATVICHYNIFHRKFRMYDGGRLEVGMPREEHELTSLGCKFIFKSSPYHLSENILSSGEIPRITEYETPTQVHKELVLESLITDELKDDMCLIINTRKGLIILLGDSHSGPVNSTKHAMRATGVKNVYAIMGGMNLVNEPQEKIESIAKGLKQINPRYIIPLHSTGFLALHYFYEVFKDKVLLLNTGDKFTLGD
ncbi:MAG: MBL fold metallo-hydrolase [Calditrichae bacterium]|nr:MBL fold metallo-hydrolase [Calditrichia bacterium]